MSYSEIIFAGIVLGAFVAVVSALFIMGRQARHILENTRICPHCGYRMEKNYRVCQKCGKESEPEFKRGICPNPRCGAKISDDEVVCHRCGIKLKDDKKYKWI